MKQPETGPDRTESRISGDKITRNNLTADLKRNIINRGIKNTADNAKTAKKPASEKNLKGTGGTVYGDNNDDQAERRV